MALNTQQLLERLSDKERDVEDDVDVTFYFSHDDFDYLVPLAEEIGDTFADKLNVEYDSVVIMYDEHPQEKGENGESNQLPPQFTLGYQGPLTAAQFAVLDDLAAQFAKQKGLTYRGIQAEYDAE